ncbi:hypothetical protein [Embleya sp. NPDC005971]|uniref:hypothetical protein n=1 Tax=Embleya sp. NPDC005971 TaxID=3156724 RepID=UPI0033F2E603
MNVIKAQEIGTPLALWEGEENETEEERAARLDAGAEIYRELLAEESAAETGDFALTPYIRSVLPSRVRRQITARPVLSIAQCGDVTRYTYGLDISGRVARYVHLVVAVVVTTRGHWFRPDDDRDPMWNDMVCRGCGSRGHFVYILDHVPCTNPPTMADIRTALTAGPLVFPGFGIEAA